MPTLTITARHRSILLAVAQGRAKVAASGYPDLTVDGRWCDHGATWDLLRAGLLRPARPATRGELVPAALTEDGGAVLGLPHAAA
ncbi:MAG TPA: hypothetical protein VFM37_15770 [Pseudonocardiaceae bacterium]|nr:hypothetical protein [Pseudonocardiaceae bacterium]